MDTCHAFQAGYDLSNAEGVDLVWRGAEKILGPDVIRLIHLNDSKRPFGGRSDRHEHIGKGTMGRKGMAAFLTHPGFSKVPLILETPKDTPDADKKNLATVRRLAKVRN
jgi:deoxyribonuclease-4